MTTARHWPLSWPTQMQPIPPSCISLRSIWILFSYLRLGLTSGPFPSGFPTKTLYTTFSLPYVLHAPPISYPVLLDLITLILFGEEYNLRWSSLCTFHLFGPNILLSALFSNTPHFVFFSWCQRPSFTYTQNYMQNYNFVYFKFYDIRQHSRRQNGSELNDVIIHG
jgi:hypothetical protein